MYRLTVLYALYSSVWCTLISWAVVTRGMGADEKLEEEKLRENNSEKESILRWPLNRA